MDLYIQQECFPEDFTSTYLDLDTYQLQQNHPFSSEPVTHHHQMYKDSTIQHQSSSNPTISQVYSAEFVQQPFINQDVHQGVDGPPFLGTHDQMFRFQNETHKSKSDIPALHDGKSRKRTHICKICQKGFFQKSHLTQHLLAHTTDKPYVCEYCNRSFKYKGNLNKHSLIHTDERSYVCNICERRFVQERQLSYHLLTHTKKHICKICNKYFTTKYTLDRHCELHSKNILKRKKHICKICNKCFTRKDGLDRHCRLHAKNRLLKRKKTNKNTEEAKTQIMVPPISEPQLPEVEVHQQLEGARKRINISKTDFSKHLEENPESAVEQQQINNKEKQVNYAKAVSDYSEMQFAENCVSDLMNSEEKEHLDYIQEIDSINPTIDAQGFNNVITINQQDIADHGYHSLPQIGNQTLAEIVPETFSINEQRPWIHDEQPEINYIVPSSSAMFPAEVNQNIPPDSSYAFTCDQNQF